MAKSPSIIFALIATTDKLMQAHGYANVGVADAGNEDATVLRYRSAADPVLADRLPPINIKYSGLELIATSNPEALARKRVSEVMTT